MKVSIITPTFNSEKTISDNINSILKQNHEDWEQIIIDNKSSDKTIQLINKFNNPKINIYSDSDLGIYDALNKGIEKASGEVISILHSDDFYYEDTVLFNIIDNFRKNRAKIIYGNLVYVGKNNNDKVIRFWKSNKFKTGFFYNGWSPPHPSFFAKKEVYDKFGNYNINLGNASDIDLMFRFLEKNKLESLYLNKIFVVMRYGGASNKNLSSIIKQNISILRILGIQQNFFKIIFFLINKIINRAMQFFYKP